MVYIQYMTNTNTECVWCGNPVPKGRKDDYCSEKCGIADAKDYEATERDKWRYYNEV
jgi:predicted nucleic acid-binding Zn ribbon protein